MPALPKSSSTKRAGAPKAKGAVRAKSGCYTCRIRRKKCDEQPDDAGQCQTCVRLRLECLGFGAKRPEWLRESRNVVDLREKIKGFLAAQGMIKGHSGSGPRSAEQEPPRLRLAEEYSSSSESPPTPTLSLSSDTIRRHHHTSSIRDDASWPPLDTAYGQSGLYPSPHMRPDSPYDGSQGSVNDHLHFHQQMSTINSSNSLVPCKTLSFSQFYTQEVLMEDYEPEYIINEDYMDQTRTHLSRNPSQSYPPQFIDKLVTHYMKDVVNIQYLLADKSIPGVIFETVSSHQSSRDAVSLLASVHWSRWTQPNTPALSNGETQERFKSLSPLLLKQSQFTAGDAMAALHVVSSILFDGGKGAWRQWLRAACTFVAGIFARYRTASDALVHSSPKDAFIIKTTIWFDVLASVTTQEDPFFFQEIENMFSPTRSVVQDISAPPTEQYSMLSPMGCENHVVWALAQTSHLSVWKRSQVDNGRLSIPELVARGATIDAYLEPTRLEGLNIDNISCSRRLAADIFRSSTRLYLHSVVSGDYPHVRDIQDSVKDTIVCIQRSPMNHDPASITESVVRSTVFSLCICGALADNEQHRQVIRRQLESGSGVGNCGTILTFLEDLWDKRAQGPRSAPVPWRDQLNRSTLLLV
ncbi:fungal-specific transcription factor domain-containing protein [Collybia nuda]|uniref:Fungal-specific transcription factor domain-containing protein n=1 Tax=Collybia nuda TaxID=64659 RepID=A0A9P5YEW2_9AGAR|nr:fungal-specific transcription factor domain-containing protein [Collybia nuda]